MAEQSFTFSEDERRDILQTALLVQAAERALPVAQQRDLASIVEAVGFALSPGSLALSSLNQIERRFDKVQEWKYVTGTLVHVDKEISNGRAVLVTMTDPNKHNFMSGQEIVRTGSTLWDPLAKDLANRAVQHVGDQVTMRVAIEQMENNNKVRVVHDILFRGPNTDFFPNGEFVAPQIRWDVLGGGGKPFDTSKLATFQK